MIKIINSLIKYGLYIFVFLLPWQTRWIYQDAIINGGAWEYGRMSLYGTEILLIVILVLGVISWLWQYQRMICEERVKEIKDELKGVKLWIILLAIWSVLSIIWAADKNLAWYGWLRLMEGVGLFWLIMNQSRTCHEQRERIANESRTDADNPPKGRGLPADGSRIFIIVVISGLVQAIFGIIQFMRQALIPANKWLGLAIIDPWQAGTSVIEFLDQRWLRAYGSFPHPNILGGFLAICLLVVIINLWRSDTYSQGRKFTWLNIFYCLSAVIIFSGLLVTFSRSAWLAFFMPFIGSFIYGLIKKAKNIVKINAIVMACFIGVIGIFLAAYPYQLITTRFHQATRLEKMSMEQRIASLRQAQFIIKNNPVIGVGFNNYTVDLQKNEPNQPAWYYQPAHNVYLLVFSELGVIGLGSLILILISLTISIIKQRNKFSLLFLSLLIIGLFDHYLWSLYFGLMLGWLVVGLLVNQTFKES